MIDHPSEKDLIAASQVSYRIAVGILGILFPVILLSGGFLLYKMGQQPDIFQTSVSAYYHTGMRDIFVGVLFVIGLALYFYQGFEKKPSEPFSDNLVANVAGFSALGVALFPTASAAQPHALAHSIFATLFFLTIAYFCRFVFTRTDKPDALSEGKKRRNRIYRACAIVILVSLVLIAVVTLWFPEWKENWYAVFWLESLAIATFGYAWWTKAEASLLALLGFGAK